MWRFFKTVIAYGVIGWAIDTAYRSFLAGQYESGTIIPFFSIIYVVGAFLIIEINEHLLHNQPLWIKFLGFAFFATMVEYIGGLIALQYLNERLWDYSDARLNIGGFIDPFHSIAWGLLSLALVDIRQWYANTRTRPRARQSAQPL